MSIPVFSRSLLQSFEIEAIFNKIKRQEFGEGEGLGRPDDPCIYLLREGVVTTTAANGVVNNMCVEQRARARAERERGGYGEQHRKRGACACKGG